MSKIFVLATLLCEVIMTLVCVHMIFRQKFKLEIQAVGTIGVVCTIYWLVNEGGLSPLLSLTAYVVIFSYCCLRFRRKLLPTIAGFVVTLIMVAGIEATVACAMIPFQKLAPSEIIALAASIFSLGIALGIQHCTEMFKRFRERKVVVSLLCGFGIYGVVLTDYYFNQGQITIYSSLIFAFMLVLFLYKYRLEREKKEVEKKNLELEIQKVYGGAYEQLLNEVRIRQHDFKNQLSAIYSMHTVAGSMEELVAMQSEYGNRIAEECKFDPILTSCNNSILAGYIYYNCIAGEKKKIDITYKICLDQVNSSFSVHELIEILGIFFNNAYENLAMNPQLPQRLKLDFREEENVICFSFSNPIKDKSEGIGRLFEPGYSTKGENRGMGLARAKELVNIHGSEIKVFHFAEDEVNWINFTICIVKQKDAA